MSIATDLREAALTGLPHQVSAVEGHILNIAFTGLSDWPKPPLSRDSECWFLLLVAAALDDCGGMQ